MSQAARRSVLGPGASSRGGWGTAPPLLGALTHPQLSEPLRGFMEAPCATRLIQPVAVGDSLSSRVKDVAGSASTASPILKPPGSPRPRPGWRVQVPWEGLPLALASPEVTGFFKTSFLFILERVGGRGRERAPSRLRAGHLVDPATPSSRPELKPGVSHPTD